MGFGVSIFKILFAPLPLPPHPDELDKRRRDEDELQDDENGIVPAPAITKKRRASHDEPLVLPALAFHPDGSRDDKKPDDAEDDIHLFNGLDLL